MFPHKNFIKKIAILATDFSKFSPDLKFFRREFFPIFNFHFPPRPASDFFLSRYPKNAL
jgi:hypothetical protein